MAVEMDLAPIEHTCKGKSRPTMFGFMWTHASKIDGTPCSGVVRVCGEHKEESKETWKYGESVLTLLPSLLCEKCGLHGFITDGYWREC